jgi:hypothetical protein
MNPSQIHVIHLVGTRGRAYTLTNAQPAEYFGKPSITGKAMASKQPHWIEGTTVYVPLDRIEVVVVYENEEEYKNGMKKFAAMTPGEKSIRTLPKTVSRSRKKK